VKSSAKMDQDLKTFTGWKLDVQAAVRADKKVSLAAASVFAAFMDFVNQETRTAWPSIAALAIATGTSAKTIKKHLDCLVEAKWLERVGKGPKGTTKYRVTDHRMNAVMDLKAMDLDRHREKQNERQAKRRKLQDRSGNGRDQSGQAHQLRPENVTVHGFRPNRPMSRDTGSDLSQYTGTDEHLQETPSVGSYEGREAYRRAKYGE